MAPARKAQGARRRPSARAGFLAGADRPAWLLLAAWVATRLYPYVPSLDPGKYWRALRPVLTDPLPHGGDPARLGLLWLLCCMLVEAAAGAGRTVRLFPILAGAIFLGRVLMAGDALSSADVAGACVAYALWLLLFRRAPARHAILAGFLAALLVAVRFPPLHGLDWPAWLERFFVYGGLIWLLGRAGMRPVLATLATAGLLVVIGLSQTHLHPAAIQDAGVALAAGVLLYLAGLSLPRRSRP
jgi:hypothetical protein